MSKNEAVAGEADVRAINLAKMAGTSLYIVHLDNKQGVDAVAQAREEGYPIFAETCPQYLAFTKEVYKNGIPELDLRARDFVCSPPMKGKESCRNSVEWYQERHCIHSGYRPLPVPEIRKRLGNHKERRYNFRKLHYNS